MTRMLPLSLLLACGTPSPCENSPQSKECRKNKGGGDRVPCKDRVEECDGEDNNCNGVVDDNPECGWWGGDYVLTILRGEGSGSWDTTNDPDFRVEVELGSDWFATQIIQEDKEPVWNRKFNLSFDEDSQHLEFQVAEWDTIPISGNDTFQSVAVWGWHEDEIEAFVTTDLTQERTLDDGSTKLFFRFEREAGDCANNPEVCDGVDNDCNGEIDDAPACVPWHGAWELDILDGQASADWDALDQPDFRVRIDVIDDAYGSSEATEVAYEDATPVWDAYTPLTLSAESTLAITLEEEDEPIGSTFQTVADWTFQGDALDAFAGVCEGDVRELIDPATNSLVRVRMVRPGGQRNATICADDDFGPFVQTYDEGGGTCEAPEILTLGQQVFGTTGGRPDNHVGSCNHVGGLESVFAFTAPATGRVDFELGNVTTAQSSPGAYLSLYARETCSDPLTEITCAERDPWSSEQLTLDVVSGVTYALFVDGENLLGPGFHEEGSYVLTVGPDVRMAP